MIRIALLHKAGFAAVPRQHIDVIGYHPAGRHSRHSRHIRLLLGTGGRLLLTGKGKVKGKYMLPLSLRRIRPWASTSTYGMGRGRGRRAKSSTRNTTDEGTIITSPTKVGVYAGGVEMPFTSTLRIVDPDKLPVSKTSKVSHASSPHVDYWYSNRTARVVFLLFLYNTIV